MKRLSITLIIVHHSLFICNAQDLPAATEQQLENITDAGQAQINDDSYLLQLEHFKKHPLNLNDADAGELKELMMLTDLQIDNLMFYRRLLGKFISIYELQSIPGWDVATINNLLPYVTVSDIISPVEEFSKRWKNGDPGLLARSSEILERSRGFDKSATGMKYLGSREKLFFRYRYQFKNLLQYGILGDKDAGEQFFRGAQKYGFDFYSFHLFATKMGRIQALALGDFTVNMGQGLIQWQGLAFGKSSDIMAVKRQSEILRPYNSSGEFYFNRGAGITMGFGNLEATAFASVRKLSANFITDSLGREDFITSFINSGYHRTEAEIETRNKLQQISYGGSLSYRGRNWHIGMNGVYYQFSIPLLKRDEPYNLYAISGNHWSNFSVDYSYTHRNFHFFGEAAADKNLNLAFVNGLLISVDPKVDLALVQRTIDQRYQAVYGNAFTQNTGPSNEKGFYMGARVRPFAGWQLDMYADFYQFSWLKYLTDAPSWGKDFLAQLSFNPNRQLEIYSRFRSEAQQTNAANGAGVANYLVMVPKQSWRTELNYKINASTTVRDRVELIWYDKQRSDAENGFLVFFDFIYKPAFKHYLINSRLQYFETDSYNSRVYGYEDDVMYSFSIPAFFGKGYRYYLNFNYDLKKHLSVWLRWAQTICPGQPGMGSGLDQIQADHQSEIKLQAVWVF